MPTITGLASGLDTAGLINAVVTAAAAPRTAMKGQLAALKDDRDKVAAFQGKLQSLLDTLAALREPEQIAPPTTSVFGSGGFSATSTTAASVGTHDVRVVSLAASQVSASQGFADHAATGAIGTGTLSVTVGGVRTDLTIDAAHSSLDEVAGLLDGVDGLSAWVVDTGAGATPYQLVVMGDDTGLANGFTFDPSGLTGTVPVFASQRDAADAEVRIDAITLFSASNTVDGAIPGVTLTLEQPSDTTARLTIGRDADAVKATLQSVVDAYNEVSSYYRAQTAYNADLGIKGGLVGDATARRLMQDLSASLTASRVTGGPLTALSQLGVRTKQDGDLELDADAFDAAIASGYDDAVAFLASDAGPFAAVRARLDDVYLADGGLLDTRTKSLDDGIADTQDRIDRFTDSLDKLSKRMQDQFNHMEQVMAQLQSASAQLAQLLPQTSLISGK